MASYLTQYESSGLAANFGKNYGPMRNYSSCNTHDDPCNIHDQQICEVRFATSHTHTYTRATLNAPKQIS